MQNYNVVVGQQSCHCGPNLPTRIIITNNAEKEAKNQLEHRALKEFTELTLKKENRFLCVN